MPVNDYEDAFQQYGQQYGVDPNLLKAQAQIESSGNPLTPDSDAGAVGLMQLLPKTAKSLGVDPTDPIQSIKGAAQLMAENLKRYNGDPQQAILAYHGGTNQANWGDKTHNYLGKVSKVYQDNQAASSDLDSQVNDILKPSGSLVGDAANDTLTTEPDDPAEGALQRRLAKIGSTQSDPAEEALQRRLAANKQPVTEAAPPAIVATPAATPAQDTMGDVGHYAGLGTRAFLNGVTSLPALATDIPAAVGNGLANTYYHFNPPANSDNKLHFDYPSNGINQTLNDTLAQLGVPQPGTKGERIGSDVLSALTGSRTMIGGGQAGTGAISNWLAAGPKTQYAASLLGTGAGSEVREEGGSQGQQVAASVLASLLAPGTTGAMNILKGGGVRPEISNLAGLAKNNYGIDVPAPQISNSPFVKWLDSALPTVPFSGHGGELAAAKTQFTKAVSNTFGENTSSLTRDAMDQAGTNLSNKFNAIAQKMPQINIGGSTLNQLSNIASDSEQVLGKPGNNISKQIDKIMDLADPQGNLSSDSWQALMRANTPLDRLAKDKDPNISYYARQIKDSLYDGLTQSAPKDLVDDLNTAKSQWKNYKTVQDLAAKAGVTGEINPALLLTQTNKTAKRFGSGGLDDLQNLSDIGQQFFKSMPSSGTSERDQIYRLLGAGGGLGSAGTAMLSGNPLLAGQIVGGIGGTMAASRAASSAINSNWYRNMLLNSKPMGNTSFTSPLVSNGLNLLNQQNRQ